LLLKHINSGKRTKRLQPRPGLTTTEEIIQAEEPEAAA